MIRIRLFYTTDDLDAEQWNMLAGENALATYGWLKTVEQTYIGPIEPVYILVCDEQRYLGGTVCYKTFPSDTVETLDDMIFGRLRNVFSRFGFSLLPALVCGPMYAYGGHLFLRPGLTAGLAMDLYERLLNKVMELGRTYRMNVAFPYVMQDERTLIRFLRTHHFKKGLHVPLACLDIKWSTFGDYLQQIKRISKKEAGNIRRHINKNSREGTLISRLDNPVSCNDRLYHLATQNHVQHNQKPYPFDKSYFIRLKENLGQNAVFYISEKQNLITGISLFIKCRNIAYSPLVAVDHRTTGNDFTFFNLAHYYPIQDAIQEGWTKMFFGRSMEELKARRGCYFKDLSIYIKFYSTKTSVLTRAWLFLLNAWIRKKRPDHIVFKSES